MTRLPLAKSKDILIQETRDEVLIYNLQNNQIHCLNETAAKVWQSCDGNTSFEAFNQIHPNFNDDLIWLTLNELQKQNLLEHQLPQHSNMRRKFVVGMLTSAILLPAITTLIAPTAANAQSIVVSGAVCGNGFQTPPEQCDDGNGTNGDGCDSNCTATSCGNGIVSGGEACDDGNPFNGDGCSITCQIEP